MSARNTLRYSIAALALAGAVLTSPAAFGEAKGKRLMVSITNLTKGQIMSPVVVGTHRASATPLFTPGEAASSALIKLAESGDATDVEAAMNADSDYLDVAVSMGPIMPGPRVSVVLDSHGKFRHVSLASMLVTTNDTFVALRGAPTPKSGSWVHMAIAYDAGSEENTEDCDDIPGPPLRHAGNARGRRGLHLCLSWDCRLGRLGPFDARLEESGRQDCAAARAIGSFRFTLARRPR